MSLFVVLAVAVLCCLSAVSGQTCGGAGYDLSSLANTQHYYFDGEWVYSVSPCGVVNNATACPNPNYPNTAFCQARPGNDGTSLGQYSPANSSWYASTDGKTVTQTMQDGTPCGDFYRETSFVYMCDPTATTPILSHVEEVHSCYYSAYFRTAAVCSPANGATGPYGGIGSTWFDARCGGGKYDLSPLSTYDLFWTPDASTATTVWFLRTCQPHSLHVYATARVAASTSHDMANVAVVVTVCCVVVVV